MSNKRDPNTTTTFGFIDSASITHVVQAYEVFPDKSYPCGWTVPRLVTALLISTENIHLAPGTSKNIKIWSKGTIGDATRNLLRSGIMSRPSVSDAIQQRVLQETQNQATRECENLKRRFSNLRQNDETQHWMDWSIRSAWEEHAQNFGGLIDEKLIPQLALILETSQKDLLKLQKQTSKPEVVKDLVKRKPNTELYHMTYNCFLLGALLRGLYHELVAKYHEEQIVHHPLRIPFLPQLKGESFIFDQTTVENHLINIVLHDSLCEKTTEGRLSRWAENIRKIRDANRHGYWQIDIRPRAEPNDTLRQAVDAARTLGLVVHSKKLEEFLAKTAKATIDIGSYLLTPFVSYSDTALEYSGVKADELTRKGVRAYYGRRSRLSKLAESPPGRISTYKQTITMREDLCGMSISV